MDSTRRRARIFMIRAAGGRGEEPRRGAAIMPREAPSPLPPFLVLLTPSHPSPPPSQRAPAKPPSPQFQWTHSTPMGAYPRKAAPTSTTTRLLEARMAPRASHHDKWHSGNTQQPHVGHICKQHLVVERRHKQRMGRPVKRVARGPTHDAGPYPQTGTLDRCSGRYTKLHGLSCMQRMRSVARRCESDARQRRHRTARRIGSAVHFGEMGVVFCLFVFHLTAFFFFWPLPLLPKVATTSNMCEIPKKSETE